jgi:para-nitrobenzyl esterase
VTIFGESAGGGSVMVHLTSPLSRGLFHRAMMQSPGVPTARAKVLPMLELTDAEKIATDYARSLGISAERPAALKALRALAPGISAPEEIAALSAGKHVAGFAGAIRDGKLVVEAPDTAIAAGHQAVVPVVDLANSEDDLFKEFGPDAAEARKLYDPRGDQTLEELKQQVLADKTLVEPARHLADTVARSGQPVWLYRFAYVSQAQRGKNMGTLHGFKIPFTMNIPSAMVGDKVTATDKAMGDIASGHWVQFGINGDPSGGDRPVWPRHDPAVDRLLHFTNSGVVVGTDPLKSRLDLWQRGWDQAQTANAAMPAAVKPMAGVPVTLDNFIRAETNFYFKTREFGALRHSRDMAAIDKQDVVRMNRDTLYSSAVFDLEAAPVTITLPDAGKRFSRCK